MFRANVRYGATQLLDILLSAMYGAVQANSYAEDPKSAIATRVSWTNLTRERSALDHSISNRTDARIKRTVFLG